MTRAEDDYRREFLTDEEDCEFPPPPLRYWVVVHDNEGHEDWFAYDPGVEPFYDKGKHYVITGAIRVAVVAGAAGVDGYGEEHKVEETATKGARPPGCGWERHCCFHTFCGPMGESKDCVGSDANCQGWGDFFHSWVAWRRVLWGSYTEMFDDPGNFEEHVRHVREQYKRSHFRVVK